MGRCLCCFPCRRRSVGPCCSMPGSRWRASAPCSAARSKYGSFARGEEPHAVARITRNLANQFELPVIFYAVVVLLVATRTVATIDVVAAWVFVAGRVVHTL